MRGTSRRRARSSGASIILTRPNVHVRVAVRARRCERTFGCLADGVQLSINCWRAAHVVSRVEECAQSTCVIFRESVILARHDELINEVPEVRLIQIHELMYVRRGYRVATVVCFWESFRERAAVDSTKRRVEVGE